MTKMGEGEYYYYLPHSHEEAQDYDDGFYVCRRDSPRPKYTVICSGISQDNASLIVDALNFYTDPAGILEKKYGSP